MWLCSQTMPKAYHKNLCIYLRQSFERPLLMTKFGLFGMDDITCSGRGTQKTASIIFFFILFYFFVERLLFYVLTFMALDGATLLLHLFVRVSMASL